MSEAKDITGKRFNRLVALFFSHTDKNHNQYWVFKCDCGKEIITRKSSVLNGHTKSCGCLQKEIAAKEVIKTSIIHNQSKTRLYHIWKGMVQRCTKKGNKYYFDKGIRICDEWRKDFMSFYNWSMKNGYREDLTIDRIDFNGDYKPENCRWATYREQAQNTSKNHLFTRDNKTQCIAEWCRELNIKVSTFCQRMKYGLNPFTGERE